MNFFVGSDSRLTIFWRISTDFLFPENFNKYSNIFKDEAYDFLSISLTYPLIPNTEQSTRVEICSNSF